MVSTAENSEPTGPLAVERAMLIDAGRRQTELAAVDLNGMSRQEMADHTLAVVAAAEQATVVAARMVALANSAACALTKGEHSMAGVLGNGCGMARRRSETLQLVGSSPDRYPLFYRALLEGRISIGHIEVLDRVWKKIDTNQFAIAEPELVELAAMCTPEEFGDYLNQWRTHADEDAGLDEFIRAQGQQHLAYGFDLFGSAHISGTIGPLHAEPFVDTLEANTKQHQGQTPSQARGDALVDLVLNPHGKYRAHLEVLVPQHKNHTPPDIDTEVGEGKVAGFVHFYGAITRIKQLPNPLDNSFNSVCGARTARGTPMPRAIVKLLRDRGAKVTEHTVTPDGNIADDRSKGRHFTVGQKRLIRLRDNNCRHPGCRRTARTCEYDHIRDWSQGGQSLIANGRLLCRFHHRWKHRSDQGGSTIFEDSAIQLE